MLRQTRKVSIDDVIFEIELVRQIEVNIDYILMLVANTATLTVRIKRYP